MWKGVYQHDPAWAAERWEQQDKSLMTALRESFIRPRVLLYKDGSLDLYFNYHPRQEPSSLYRGTWQATGDVVSLHASGTYLFNQSDVVEARMWKSKGQILFMRTDEDAPVVRMLRAQP